MTNFLPALSDDKARNCAGCSLCCVLPEIDEMEKPADLACVHLASGCGCTIYAERPHTCRQFYCLWVTGELGPEWDPKICGMMAYRQGTQMTVLADPVEPALWREAPQQAAIRKLAETAAAEGGYLILFAGDEVTKIELQAAELS